MKNFMIGVCFGTIGITILSTLEDLFVTKIELAKAKVGVEITKCNNKISQLSTKDNEVRAIGFTTEEG